MMIYDRNKMLSKLNRKKALVFIVTRKLKLQLIKGRVKSFTGYQTIGLIKSEKDQKLMINLEINHGQAVLVAIYKKDIFEISNINMSAQIQLPFDKGFTKLRLYGEQASLSFEITKR